MNFLWPDLIYTKWEECKQLWVQFTSKCYKCGDSDNLKLEMTALFTKPDTSIQTKEICNQIKIPLLKIKISLFKINIPIIIE